ncbi:hypothetical protein LTR50_005079 [Elasticomyces elasticus]|nr:hypothetical protein LTR50_005079 [Elasticomyces elasticus]
MSATTKPTASPKAASTGEKDDTAAQLKKLDIKTKAINTNNISRVSNAQLTSADAKLSPLVSLKTGRPIERFPETSQGIAKLTDTTVDALLLALEADRGGKHEEKRERLRVQIGLRPNPA